MALLIHWNGDKSEVHPADRENGFTLKELYRLVDCEIVEIVRTDDGRLMVVDEMGRYRTPRLLNVPATKLRVTTGFAIYGNALVCNPGEIR